MLSIMSPAAFGDSIRCETRRWNHENWEVVRVDEVELDSFSRSAKLDFTESDLRTTFSYSSGQVKLAVNQQTVESEIQLDGGLFLEVEKDDSKIKITCNGMASSHEGPIASDLKRLSQIHFAELFLEVARFAPKDAEMADTRLCSVMGQVNSILSKAQSVLWRSRSLFRSESYESTLIDLPKIARSIDAVCFDASSLNRSELAALLDRAYSGVQILRQCFDSGCEDRRALLRMKTRLDL